MGISAVEFFEKVEKMARRYNFNSEFLMVSITNTEDNKQICNVDHIFNNKKNEFLSKIVEDLKNNIGKLDYETTKEI